MNDNTFRLRKLRITNVDRVESGSNPAAHAVIYKSATAATDDEPGGDMSDEQDQSTDLDPEVVAQIEGLETSLAERDAELAELTRLREEEPELLGELIGIGKAEEPEEEDIMKSMPDEVRERIEKAESEVAALRTSERTRHFTDVAKSELDTLTESAEGLGAALMSVAEAVGEESDTYKTLFRVLKAAGAQAAEADKILTAEQGTSQGGADEESAEAKILAKATELAAEQSIGVAAAMAEVRKSDPDLFRAHEAERARTRR